MILRSAGAQAHRNRIDRLVQCLVDEAQRAATNGQPLTVLNIGCGPAGEVQRFTRTSPLADICQFLLVDFNGETIDYARARITQAVQESGRTPDVTYLKQSINDLLKDATRGALGRSGVPDLSADFVYCAGLFDYLSDKVSARVMQLLHRWTKPGGLVLSTNVHPRNDVRHFLEHLLDWNLIYRDESQMLSLCPEGTEGKVTTDATGVNVFLEIRKSISTP
jgi:extracellular factor (EF) 3-hydroxypalmitic acid methyl ester biosynthesis protein